MSHESGLTTDQSRLLLNEIKSLLNDVIKHERGLIPHWTIWISPEKVF